MFVELDAMRFEFIFEGFVLGGSIERNKGMMVLRREIKILDKLEAISESYPCDKKLPTGELARFLTKDCTIEFDKEELDLIKRYMELVPWSTGQPARNFMKVHDYLDNL